MTNLQYRVLHINSANTFPEKEVKVDGDVLTYLGPPNGPAFQCRLTVDSTDLFTLRPKTTIKFPFRSIYISLPVIAPTVASVEFVVTSPANAIFESQDVVVSGISNIASLTTVVNVERVTDLSTPVATMSDVASLLCAASPTRKRLLIMNQGLNTIYISPNAGVTTATGYPLLAGTQVEFAHYTGVLYGVCDTGKTSKTVQIDEGTP